jgi:hypothetical protein
MMAALRVMRLTVLALRRALAVGTLIFFRSAENTSQGLAGNVTAVMHTDRHSIRGFAKLPHKKGPSLGQHVREDE